MCYIISTKYLGSCVPPPLVSMNIEDIQDVTPKCTSVVAYSFNRVVIELSSPVMLFQAVYEALYHVSITYLPFVALAILVAVAYRLKKQSDEERPLKGFPVVGLEEEGLGPKEAYMKHGHKVIAKGLREHKGAFQVMTGTGPKVNKTALLDLRIIESRS